VVDSILERDASPRREVQGRKPPMNDHEKSDSAVVPKKPANNAVEAAEWVEGRALTKGNARQQNPDRTQRRAPGSHALARIHEAARRDPRQRFTSLFHHVYDVSRLRSAYLSLRRDSAAGVDEMTWGDYGEGLEDRLRQLSERLRKGSYRAEPARRAFIPKADGRQRPIGVPTLEDKIVQRAMTEVMSAIYEADFLGFSYGFRPGRSAHGALDALAVGVPTRKVSWILDADIRDFFGTLDHTWMIRFLEHRIGDRRVFRLIRKWLRAGVLDRGERVRSEKGTIQGGSISPLLANVYLHYAFDQWIHQWRHRHATAEVIVVRYADDFVIGFQRREDAEGLTAELRGRLRRFGLSLHEDKTKLIEFGPFAAARRRRRGERRPETFDFLGFTHIAGRTRKGRFVVIRKTSRQRLTAKLREVKDTLRRRFNAPVPELGSYLRSVLLGHMRYYAVPFNYYAIASFRRQVRETWHRMLERRSERTRIPLRRMDRLESRWLPPCRICHPYPDQRLRVPA